MAASGVTFRLATALAAAAAAMPATATVPPPQDPTIVALSVIDRDSGAAKPQYVHDHRTYVAGETGARYSVRLDNVSDGRVLVVLSVDGVNAISGETAALGQRGYVLEPHQSGTIDGWRKSLEEIAAFRFAPLPQSYAARTGRPGDVGVIGIAVFREVPREIIVTASRAGAVPPPPAPMAAAPSAPAPVVMQSVAPPPPSAAPAPPAVARRAEAAPTTKLGTAHGEIERSAMTLVAFQRASAVPASTRTIEYDSVANLVAAGVLPPEPRHPRPFPATRHDGFVPDPPAAPGGE